VSCQSEGLTPGKPGGFDRGQCRVEDGELVHQPVLETAVAEPAGQREPDLPDLAIAPLGLVPDVLVEVIADYLGREFDAVQV